jgi:hypothetical protein
MATPIDISFPPTDPLTPTGTSPVKARLLYFYPRRSNPGYFSERDPSSGSPEPTLLADGTRRIFVRPNIGGRIQENDSITRFIAGCLRFLTLIQCF